MICIWGSSIPEGPKDHGTTIYWSTVDPAHTKSVSWMGCHYWGLLWTGGDSEPSLITLTHWGRVTHICVGKLTIIASDNGLSPGRHQAIIWTNAGILLLGPLGTNFNEILIENHTFSFKKLHLKMSSAKWRPFCLGLNVLTHCPLYRKVTWPSLWNWVFEHFGECHRISLIWSQPLFKVWLGAVRQQAIAWTNVDLVLYDELTYWGPDKISNLKSVWIHSSSAPFYKHGLTLIPVWKSNHVQYKLWDEMTYPFQNFNGCTVEV